MMTLFLIVYAGGSHFFTGFLSLQQTYSNPSSIEHRNQHHTLGKPDRLESTPNNQKGGDSENRCSGISPFSPVFSRRPGVFRSSNSTPPALGRWISAGHPTSTDASPWPRGCSPRAWAPASAPRAGLGKLGARMGIFRVGSG